MSNVTAANCGNGFLEPGEECDCGSFPDEVCSKACCNGTTCKLRPTAKCASGLCCELATCNMKSVEMVCRPVEDDCDVEDHCDGNSSLCGDDVKPDGSMCTDRQYCYNGKCQPRNAQYSQLWLDESVVSAGERCYSHTTVEDSNCFYCDYNVSSKTSIPCKQKDVLCGSLLCDLRQIHPDLKSLHDRCQLGLECVCAVYKVDRRNSHATFVNDGTSCGRSLVTSLYLVISNCQNNFK
ncbi:hypothetical protein HELRODRAFT_99723 [Helobdella robusta]|uniref:Disintegrin domain-containing protein n=1 Tax=Helobdella robusta TaxID=6412 RepID=T1G9U8_HELRO|nr:hypothetical protein HELRODRAFT_99723 [Helobdella robusta]ESO03887.1 hypothetical protein HELRODRAFT_99723 [Helobdella robusta]